MTLGAVSDGGVLLNDLVDLLLDVRPWCRFMDEARKLSSNVSSDEFRRLVFSGLLRLSRRSSTYVSPAYAKPAEARRPGLFCATPPISPFGDTARACRFRRSTVLEAW